MFAISYSSTKTSLKTEAEQQNKINVSIKQHKIPRTDLVTLFFSPEKNTGHGADLRTEPHTQSNKEGSVLDHRSYYFS